MPKIKPAPPDVPGTATTGERAYQDIRSDILSGRLRPGQKLTLEKMKAGYGASVSTLREILSRLSSEGLIVAEGARGFEVAPTSPEDLRELADMRRLLEGHALRESFKRGDIAWEGRVVAAHHMLASVEGSMADGDRSKVELWQRYDSAFHGALISACGSTVLLRMHASVYDQYLRYQMIAAVFRGRSAAAEHGRLLKCALARDWRAAQALLATHMHDCVEHMIAGGSI